MRTINFAKRCFKEIIRDPLNIIFGLGFPVVLLLLLSAIQANVPVDLFKIESLAPGICVFGLSFITLFSATLIAKDRESEFLQRLFTTPMKSYNFILGYMIPLIPLSFAQSMICYFVSVFLGLPITINILYATLLLIPMTIFYISLGLLGGSVFNVKQVGGICGALVTNLSAWLSGVWFDLNLVGGTFNKIARCLPFVHAVDLERGIINDNFNQIFDNVWPILIYCIITTILSIVVFLRKMRRK